jgi:hypothetical protein
MKTLITTLLISISILPAFARRGYNEKEVLAYAKTLTVDRLDKTLPLQPIDEWLRSPALHFDTMLWVVDPGCDRVLHPNEKANPDWTLCVVVAFGRHAIGDVVRWELNRACDEDTMTSAAGYHRETTCSESAPAHQDQNSPDGWLVLDVGRIGTGARTRPRLRSMKVGMAVGGYFGSNRLSDLPKLVRRASSVTPEDTRVLDYVRQLDAQKLEPGLPSQPLEQWLRAGTARIDAIVWEVIPYCQLQEPPGPAPLCARIQFTRGAGTGEGMIQVGTVKNGITGLPLLLSITPAKTLSNLPEALDALNNTLTNRKLSKPPSH